MKEKLVALVAYLNAQTAFTNVLGTRLYPGVAPAGAAMPFAVYTIGKQPLTKDAANYPAAIQVHFPVGEYTEMLEFAEVCHALLDANHNYEAAGIDTDYNEDYTTLYATIQFTID